MLLFVRLLSVHLHFGHVGDEHKVHAHSHVHAQLLDLAHGENDFTHDLEEVVSVDVQVVVKKQLFSFDLLASVFLLFAIPVIIGTQFCSQVRIKRLRPYQLHFHPPLRAPPA